MTGLHFLDYAFWCAAFLVLYTYAGYPLWIYFRSRLQPRPQQRGSALPSVTIILAVHNGAALLRQKVAHLLSLDYPQDRLDIAIISDGSTDGTDKILEEFRGSRIRCTRCSEHNGKAAALNLGMQTATGEILLFLDIRPWIESNALQFLISNFADPSVGCVAGELVLSEDGHDAGAKAIGGLYWKYERWIRNSEAAVDSPLGVYGGFYAVRRNLARALPNGVILDDMLLPLSIIRQGYRSVVDLRARVYDIWPNNLRGEFHRKVRTLAGNFQLLQIAPWLLSKQNRLRFELISHKLLRLLVPLLLLILLVSSLFLASHSVMYMGALASQVVFYLFAAMGSSRVYPLLTRISGPASAFCMLNAAVVVGFYKFLFTKGPLWKIWTSGTPATPANDGIEGTEWNATKVSLRLHDQLREQGMTR